MKKQLHKLLLIVAMMVVPWVTQAQTPGDPISTFPYSCDFEGSDDSASWVTVNGTQENKWYVGSAVNATVGGSHALYVSNNSGTSNAYDVVSADASYTWAYQRFTFDPGTYNITLKWRCTGEQDGDPYDFFRIFVVPDATTLTAGALPSTSYTWSNQFMSDVPTGWIGVNGTNSYFCGQSSFTTLASDFAITTYGNYKLVFLWLNDDNTCNNPPAAIDDIVITASSCSRPTGLVVSNITASSATLTWTPGASENSWLVSDGTNSTVVTDTFYTFTGLSPITNYTVSVRSLCSASDTSNPATATFRTACGLISSLPYSNNFDSEPSYSSVTYANAFPDCWTRINDASGTYNYYPYLYATTTYAHSGSTGMYWYHTTTTTYADNEFAVLPGVDTTVYSMSDLTLSFYAKTTGTSYHPAPVVGVMTDPTDASTFTPVYNFTSTEITTTWTMFVISFENFTGYGNYIAIKWARPSSYSYMAIDDIYLTDEWCDIPLDVTAMPGLDEVTVNWGSNGGTTFEVVLGTDTVSNITDTFYTFTGLTPNTLYNYSVAVLCAGGPSAYIGGSVRTLCSAMDSLPYRMSFEASEGVSTGGTTSTTFVNCWTRLNNGTDYFGYPYVASSTTYAHTGSRGLYWYMATTTGTYGDYMVMALPAVDTTLYPVNNLELLFWARSSSTSYYPVFEVGVMTNPADYSSFQSVQTINVGNSTRWDKYTADLSSFTGSGAYVAIRATRAGSYWYCYMDDIELREQRDCPLPINLQALSTTVADSVVIGWSCPGSDGNDFDIAISTPGFDPDTMDVYYLLSSSYDSTYTFTNLVNAQTYDVYVRTNCSTEPSYWAGPLTVTPGSMNMQVTGTQTVYMCNGIIYDDGGPNGNYSDYCNATLYVYPPDSTKALVVSGWSYDEGSLDYLRIYEGHRTSGTPLYDDYGVTATQNFGPFITGGGPITITFHTDGSVQYSGFQINVSCIDLPDCQRPANFALTRLLPDTIDFTWTDPSGEVSEWLIEYGPSGFNRNSTTDTNIHWLTFYDTHGTIDGLTPNVDYDFYLMANCGSDTSIYRLITVRTPCYAYPTDSLPYHYGFEDATSGTSGHINGCWRKGAVGVSSYYPYASTSYRAEGTKSLYFYGYSETYKCYAAMPLFEAPIRDLMVTFKLYKTSDTYGSIEVGVMTDPNDMSTFTSLGTFQPTVTSQWQEFSQTFRNYHGTGQFIAFVQRSTYYTYLDDITVDLAPTCPPAYNVTVANHSTSSAFVTWGFRPGYADVPDYYEVTLVDSNATRITDTTSHLYYMLSNLDLAADYTVVVNPVCGGTISEGDSTDFSTNNFGCLEPDTTSFDTIQIGTATTTSTYLPSYSFYNYGLSQQIYTPTEIGGGKRITGIAVMPQNVAQQRTYEIYLAHTSATSLTSFIHPSDMTQVYNSGAITLVPNQWLEFTFDTPFDYNGSDNLLVCFRDMTGSYVSGNAFYAHSKNENSVYAYQDGSTYDPFTASGGTTTPYRNNIKIMGSDCSVMATCANPLVHVVNIADTAVELVWGAGGTESSWDVEHRVAGSSSWTTDLTSTSLTSYVITSLTPNTQYEFRVSHMCSELYSTIVTATTPCSPTAVPLRETFASWSTGSGSPAASCWHKISTYSSGYPYVTTGYSSDGDNRAVYFYTSSSAYSALVLPPFDAPVDTLTLTFALMRTYDGYTHTVQVGVVTDPEDMSTFQAVGQATPTGLYEWNYHEFSFRGMPNGLIAIRTAPGAYAYPYLDEIEVNYFNPCIRPYGLDASNVTLTTATVTWYDSAATNFEYEYGPSGFTRGTGTIGTATTTSAALTGLVQGTNYDFYVRGICSAGDTSLWSFRYTFSTECGLLDAVPYYEDFNSWGTGSSVHAPNCWSYGSDYSTSYPYIYSSYNHSGSTGGSMYMYNYTGSIANSLTYFSLPAVDTNVFTANQLQVVFYGYTSTSSYVHQVIVGACVDEGDMSTFHPVDTVVVPYGEWNIYEVPLDSVPANARYITLASAPASGYNYSYPCIDDLTIERIPTCKRPDSLTATGATTTTVNLSWHERGGATDWLIEYGPVGFQIGTGTVVYANSNPFTLTGLPSSYNGEYYVRSICSSSDTGDYSRTPCRFSTSQLPASIPYHCSFEDSTEWAGWQTNSNTSVNWYRGNAVAPYDSSYCMYVSPDGGVHFGTDMSVIVNAATWRDIDFGTVDSTFELTFRYKCGGTTTARYDGLMVFLVDPATPVEASTAAITSPWGNVNNLYRIANLRLDTAWTLCRASFDTIHGVKRVAFFWFNQGTGTGSFLFGPAAVDDININYAACPRPVNLDTVALTSTAATLHWDGSSATNYRVAYRVSGADASTNLYAITSTNSITLTGLTPMTTYRAWVQKLCGSDSSLFSDGVEFTMNLCEDAVEIYPGDSTSTTSTSNALPVNNYWKFTVSEIIIDSAEIGGPLDINGIKVYYDYTSPSTVKNDVDIYIKPTTKTTFSSSTDCEYVDTTAVLVYHGPFNCQQGWNVFGFDTVYHYDGNGNLMLMFDDNSNAYNGSSYVFRTRTCTGEKSLVYYSDSDNPVITSPSLSSYSGSKVTYAYRPEMKLVSCGSTPVCHEPIITGISHTYESATITWTGDGTDYEVNIKESIATNWPATDIHVTGNTYTFTGLMPATYYTFRVRQDCTADSIGYSNWVSDGVITDSMPCLPPDSLTVSNITNANATFDWIPVGTESMWELHVWFSGGLDSIYTVSSHPVTVGGFNAGVTYNAAVRPLCGTAHNIVGDWGTPITFTTAICPDVTGLTAGNVTANSVTLSWTADPLAVSWIIEYGYHGFDQGTGTTIPTTLTTYIVNGLLDDMQYDFRVRAVCGTDWQSEGWANVSATTQAGGVPCEAPTNVSAVVAGNSATISWTANTGNISYELEYGPRGFGLGSGTTVTATSSPVTLSNLDYETDYDVYVQGICDQETRSAWSSVASFTTEAQGSEDCDPVTDLTADNVTESSALLSWTPGATGDEWEVVLTTAAGATVSEASTTEHQYALTGLTPGTAYVAKVRTVCGDGVYSSFASTSFTTVTIGIDGVVEPNCTIYPNPTSSATTISVTGISGKVKIAVVDMNGREVTSEMLECSGDCAKSIDVNNLAQGAYFVRITGENVSMVKKLIVR